MESRNASCKDDIKKDKENIVNDNKDIDSSVNRYKKEWSVNINNSKEVKVIEIRENITMIIVNMVIKWL